MLGAWGKLLLKGTPVTSKTLSLRYSLFNGQAFTWHKAGNDFFGTCGGAYYELRHDPQGAIEWRSAGGSSASLLDYFALELDYDKLFEGLIQKDSNFKKRFEQARGLRIMRQDPWECTVAFVCSQNNNIKRITVMVQTICRELGEEIYVGEHGAFHTFPSPEKLASTSEQHLRDLGFGYRAKYLVAMAKQLVEKGGTSYLQKLRGASEETPPSTSLIQFPGIGPKVADCISLFSLDCHWLVPVDTHMFQLCQKTYGRSFSDYGQARKFLQEKLGGKYAGLAHSFLFTFAISQFADGDDKAKDAEKKPRAKTVSPKEIRKIEMKNPGVLTRKAKTELNQSLASEEEKRKLKRAAPFTSINDVIEEIEKPNTTKVKTK
jgi:N-glycosylase/DNA lyase